MPVPSSPALHELARSVSVMVQVLWLVAAVLVITGVLCVGIDRLTRIGIAPGQPRRGGRRWQQRRGVSRLRSGSSGWRPARRRAGGGQGALLQRRPTRCRTTAAVRLGRVGDLAVLLVRCHHGIRPRRRDAPVPGPAPPRPGRDDRGPRRPSRSAAHGHRRDGPRWPCDLRRRCWTIGSHRAPHAAPTAPRRLLGANRRRGGRARRGHPIAPVASSSPRHQVGYQGRAPALGLRPRPHLESASGQAVAVRTTDT